MRQSIGIALLFTMLLSILHSSFLGNQLLFIQVRSEEYVPPHWLKKGVYAKYRIKDLMDILFINGTWLSLQRRFDVYTADRAWLRWSIEEVNGSRALVKVTLVYEVKDRTFELSGYVSVDIYTREVFLLNGSRVGVTAVWCPPNMLAEGIRFRAGEILNEKSVRGVLSKGSIRLPDGFFHPAYTYSMDDTDEEGIFIIDLRGNVTRGMKGKNWEVIDIREDPKTNQTRVIVRLYLDGESTVISMDPGAKLLRTRPNYYYEPYVFDVRSGLLIESFMRDAILLAIDVYRISAGRISIEETNVELSPLPFSIVLLYFMRRWSLPIVSILIVAILMVAYVRRRRRSKVSMG